MDYDIEETVQELNRKHIEAQSLLIDAEEGKSRSYVYGLLDAYAYALMLLPKFGESGTEK